MRAVQITQWTTPDALRLSEVAEPVCGPDQARIRMRAAPVTHALSLLVGGRYQRKPAFPFTPGNTIAGEIIEVGSAAGRGLHPGQPVLASMEFGGLATQAVAHAANVYPIPDGMDFAEAAALNTSYNSVLAGLTWPRLLDLRAGQTLLATGAAGNVGAAAIEIATALGARVIASASGDIKQAFARRIGAWRTVASNASMLRDAVMDATDGDGVDAALDPVGGDIFMQALRCLKPGGRILPIGFASGVIPQIPANLLLVKNISVVGLYMGYYKIDQRERFESDVHAIFKTLGDMYAAGQIRPLIAGRHNLADVPAAFAQALDRATVGHVVVTGE